MVTIIKYIQTIQDFSMRMCEHREELAREVTLILLLFPVPSYIYIIWDLIVINS